MPNSCRSILTRLLRSKRIKQWEHDKLLRNLKGIEWHPYPQEKPSEYGRYIVTVRTFHNNEEKTFFVTFDAFELGYFWQSGVIAWAELPEPYKEANDERNN